MRVLGRGGRPGGSALNGLFAFGFAVLIWAAVGARMTTIEAMRVPFELEVPLDVVVEYREPWAPPGGRPLVEVAVRGSHEALAKMTAADIQGRRRIDVDDAMLAQGEQMVEIGPSAFRTGTKGVEVTSVAPERVRVALSRVGRAELRVKEDVTGAPAPGFRRAGIVIEPDVIEVTGPRTLLARFQGPFLTEPIDLAGRNETFTSYRKVRAPAGLTPQDRVKVTVTIEPDLVEQEFVLPVKILTSPDALKPRYVLDPPEAKWRQAIKLRGPADKLKALRARLDKLEGVDEPIAFIRIRARLEPGNNDETIEVVNLPDGVTAVATKFNFMVKESKP